MRIGVDAMGGDYAPLNVVLGAIEARPLLSADSQITLFGDQNKITEICAQRGVDPCVFGIVHTTQVIGMGEFPSQAFKSKLDSSMVQGFRALRSGQIDAFCSAGSTGAMMVGAVLTIKTIPGIARPCLAIEIPVQTGGTALLLDVGLNTDSRPDALYDFGLLGSIYAQSIMNIPLPRVALLNNGEEEEKGTMLTREAFKLMKGSNDYFFVGNIEGTKIYSGTVADVIVTDGFVGNVMLKQAEAMYQLVKVMGNKEQFFDRFNYEIQGGAPVLGINATVVIGHGASSARAVASMIKKCEDCYSVHLVKKIKDVLVNAAD